MSSSGELFKYYCQCTHSEVFPDQLQTHLKLPYKHKILKIPQNSSTEVPNKEILKQIYNITGIKTKVQNLSEVLIQTITSCTSSLQAKLDNLIELYKNALKNPLECQEILNKEIIPMSFSTATLEIQIKNFFNQLLLDHNLTIDRQIKEIKSKISHQLAKKSSWFLSLIALNTQDLIVTGGEDGVIRIWDFNDNIQVFHSQKHKAEVFSLDVSDDDEILLSGSGDSTVRLWDLKKRMEICKFKGHKDQVRSVLISKDKKFGYSGSYDYTCIVWDLESKSNLCVFSGLFWVNQICLIDQQKTLVVAGEYGNVQFWDLDRYSVEKKTIIKGMKAISALCFTNNEAYFIAGDFEGKISVLQTSDLAIKHEQQPHTKRITKIISIKQSKYFVTSSRDKLLIIWKFLSFELERSHTFNSEIWNLCYIKRSNKIAYSLCNARISFIDIKLKTIDDKVDPKSISINNSCISRNLNFLAFCLKNKIKLYNLENNISSKHKSKSKSELCSLAFSRNCELLACGYLSGQITIFSLPLFTKIDNFKLGKNQIKSIAYSPDNEFIAYSYLDKEIIILNSYDKEIVYREEKVTVYSIVFCHRNNKVIYTVYPRKVHLLNEKFVLVRVIDIDFVVFKILVSDDGENFVVSDNKNIYTCIRMADNSKVFNKKTREEFIKWSKKGSEPLYRVIPFLRGIKIS